MSLRAGTIKNNQKNDVMWKLSDFRVWSLVVHPMSLSGGPPCVTRTHQLLLAPVVEDDSSRGLSAARPTSTAQAGLFAQSPGTRRRAAPVSGWQGC